MLLRLPDRDREASLKEHKTKLFEQHGRVMKECGRAPGALLEKTTTTRKHFEISYRYIGTRKGKAHRRKK